MSSKITLYSEKQLIQDMKLYAKEQNTSVSKIVNQFFKNLLSTQTREHQTSNITNSLVGVLNKGTTEDYDKYLEDKYL